MNEHHHQVLTVAWFRAQYPKLASLLFAIPNGGQRNPATAAILKAEGLVAGIPDLFLAIPSGAYHGLFIEMKTPNGALSQAQKRIHPLLVEYGYQVGLARGYDAAKALVKEYLNG